MIKILIETDIEGAKFSELMDFVIKRSDTVSVSRYYNGFMDSSKFSEMQETYKESIHTEDKERRNRYATNIDGYQDRIKNILGFITDNEAYEYFDAILKQDLCSFEDIKYDDFKEKPDLRFSPSYDEFIKNVFTRITPVTRNPVFELCYFKLGQISKSILSNMKGIYDYPYNIDGIAYEDITFYYENSIILAVCSHERFANLNLENEDYDIFKHFEIMHSCS